MTRSQSEGTATPKKLQQYVPNNKTLHKISLKPGLNLSIFQGSTPKSSKSSRELYISVNNSGAPNGNFWKISVWKTI